MYFRKEKVMENILEKTALQLLAKINELENRINELEKYKEMWEDLKSSLDYIDDSEFLDSMEKSEQYYLKGVNK